MKTAQLREEFLNFYRDRGQAYVAPASIVAESDPTLMFVISGMVPFKRYFCGESHAPHPRMYNVQPCIRTVDLIDVGDRHHLTFFEMLGNWSFGMVDRQKSLTNAWEFLTYRLQLPLDRLVITVFAGDASRDLPADVDSIKVWLDLGVPRHRIFELGKDNFWGPAGRTGPCGPCTEVHFDRIGGDLPSKFPDADIEGRFMEIWNAGVFLEYQQEADGRLNRIDGPGLAAGAGLERLAMVIQGGQSVYDTDEMRELVGLVQHGACLSVADSDLPQARKVADHVRAIAMILAEGVMPGKEGPSHVVRRLIRRAFAVYAAQGVWDANLGDVLDCTVGLLGSRYQQVSVMQAHMKNVVSAEIRRFREPLQAGLDRLDVLIRERNFRLDALAVFELNATFGVPRDITISIARSRGAVVDVEDYKEVFTKHRAVSRGT